MVGRIVCHMEVRNKHILGMKRKDKAIGGKGNWVKLALTGDTKVIWVDHNISRNTEPQV